MCADGSFDDLMERLVAGDQDAAREVFNRFVQRLIALARSRLDTQIRQKEDPEDVVQSVFRSFFVRCKDGQFDFGSWDSLWALLALITLRKCGNRVEYYHAQVRDVDRDAPRRPKPDDSAESRATWEVIARDPTPSQAAVVVEIIEELMNGLEDWERTILSLKLQECTVLEISSQVVRSERTVRRVLERVKKRLQRMQEEQ